MYCRRKIHLCDNLCNIIYCHKNNKSDIMSEFGSHNTRLIQQQQKSTCKAINWHPNAHIVCMAHDWPQPAITFYSGSKQFPFYRSDQISACWWCRSHFQEFCWFAVEPHQNAPVLWKVQQDLVRGTQAASGSADSTVEALGEVYGSQDTRRESRLQQEFAETRDVFSCESETTSRNPGDA